MADGMVMGGGGGLKGRDRHYGREGVADLEGRGRHYIRDRVKVWRVNLSYNVPTIPSMQRAISQPSPSVLKQCCQLY